MQPFFQTVVAPIFIGGLAMALALAAIVFGVSLGFCLYILVVSAIRAATSSAGRRIVAVNTLACTGVIMVCWGVGFVLTRIW